jgi:hypothetical protein
MRAEATMTTKQDKPKELIHELPPIAFFCDTALTIEKARVAAQVRLSHLERQGRKDPDMDELLSRMLNMEEFVDGRLEEWVLQHPTARWWRYDRDGDYGIKGSGTEAIGKVIGLIEAFGRFYPASDNMIPPYVRREPLPDVDGNLWVWVEGIERLTTPSKLWKYAGLDPGARRRAGAKLGFNLQLKTMLFRLMTSFMRQRNKYYDEYQKYRTSKRHQLQAQGIRVVPTPKGRYCRVCDQDQNVPASTRYCPVCGELLSKKEEPPGLMWEGHLDFMARRRAIKLFSAHLWVVWREELGLPSRTPYPVEYGGHSRVITPWEMCDRQPIEAVA